MSGAEGVLAFNICVAILFAAGYAILAFTNASQRAALGFSASYLMGMGSPISDFLVPMVGAPALLEWTSYISFLLATLSISITFSVFHRRRPPWVLAAGVLVVGLGLRAAIGTAPQQTIGYGMMYQLPFMLCALLAMRTVLAVDSRGPLHIALSAVFGVLGLNFMIKPFLALAFGAGRTLTNYTDTIYALLSQASSGILLLAAGLVLLLIVAQKAITESQLASETDPLSGLANRRGFDRLAQDAIARAAQARAPVSVVLFDLDHFKRVNDTYGHAAGDTVIAGFAARLRDAATAAAGPAVAGRMGGEEFVMLIEGADVHAAWLTAETLRLGMARAVTPDGPAVTVSGGVAQLQRGESLAELMRRADQASYAAKNRGRDRICLAEGEPAADAASNVRPLRARLGPFSR